MVSNKHSPSILGRGGIFLQLQNSMRSMQRSILFLHSLQNFLPWSQNLTKHCGCDAMIMFHVFVHEESPKNDFKTKVLSLHHDGCLTRNSFFCFLFWWSSSLLRLMYIYLGRFCCYYCMDDGQIDQIKTKQNKTESKFFNIFLS